MLYVAGYQNQADQLIDIEQDFISRAAIETAFQGFELSHGDPEDLYPAWGLAAIHVIKKIMTLCGAEVLFGDEGDKVPNVISDESYVQNQVARMQHAQLRESAMAISLSQREPAPIMKYIKHSSVLAWNAIGNAGVDEASKKANSMLPNSMPTEASSRLSNRVASMQLVNTPQAWRICSAAKEIIARGSFPSLSLAAMRHLITGKITPQRFIAVLLDGRGLPGITVHLLDRSRDDSDDERGFPTYVVAGVCAPIGDRVRARQAPDVDPLNFTKVNLFPFFNSGEGKKRRLARRHSDLELKKSAIVVGESTKDRDLHVESVPLAMKGSFSLTSIDGEQRKKWISGRNCNMCTPSPRIIMPEPCDEENDSDESDDGGNKTGKGFRAKKTISFLFGS